jgi:hypothetical protein
MLLLGRNIFAVSFIKTEESITPQQQKYTKYVLFRPMFAHRTVTRLKRRFAIKKSNFDILSTLALSFDVDGKEKSLIKIIFGSDHEEED